MMKSTVLDFLLDLVALLCFCGLIYAGKLTPAEGLPPLLMILGIKVGNQIKGGPRAGGVATMIAFAAAFGASTPAAAAELDPDSDTSGEHRAAE